MFKIDYFSRKKKHKKGLDLQILDHLGFFLTKYFNKKLVERKKFTIKVKHTLHT